uniref:C3H1-type domain-containing protein n=1 Tax=Astyanax mexicanus TaxID=7994 RepID=A0A3B1J7I6_ASTMX
MGDCRVMQTAALINRILCAHDGRMELEELYGQLLGLELKDEVEDALKDTDMFVITGEENKVVVAKTKLRLCRVRDCQGCSNLHLYCFHLPEKGEYGHCSDKEACVKLHVCENYIRGTCDGSTKCSRSHDFYEPHSINNFAAKRIPIQLVGSVLPAYSNRLIIWDSNRIPCFCFSCFTDKSEICLFHIRKFCKRGNGCQRVHYHLPYKWEGTDGHNWKVLPDNEEIEKAFCDPAKMYSDGTEPVYFDTMIQGFAEVRRLSTVSSVLNPTFILTTTWIWYWEDDNRNWIQYGSSVSVRPEKKKYQEDNSATDSFFKKCF